MTSRQHLIAAEMNRFLARFSPPRHMHDNPQAIADTQAQLVRAVSRALPNEGFIDLLSEIFDKVEAESQTRSWPTVFEFNRAAGAVTKAAGNASAPVKFDAAAINGRRMANGEAVAEEWLFGRMARRLLDSGVPKGRLDEYRQAALQARMDTLGEDAAMAWADSRRAYHRADVAASLEDQRRYTTGEVVRSSFKRARIVEWDA